MHAFLRGVRYPLNGLQLAFSPALRRFIIWPIICNILLFIGFFIALGHFIEYMQHWVNAYLPHWLSWLSWLLWPLLMLGGLFILLYTFALLANLIAAPFNGILSERTQRVLTNTQPPEVPWQQVVFRDAPKSILRQLAMLAYMLPRALLVLLLFIIPIIQGIAPVAWFLFGAWLLAMQYYDYPMDNNRHSFTLLRQAMRKQRPLFLGFGTSLAVMLLVPFLNCFVMPAAVIGATQLCMEHQHLIAQSTPST